VLPSTGFENLKSPRIKLFLGPFSKMMRSPVLPTQAKMRAWISRRDKIKSDLFLTEACMFTAISYVQEEAKHRTQGGPDSLLLQKSSLGLPKFYAWIWELDRQANEKCTDDPSKIYNLSKLVCSLK